MFFKMQRLICKFIQLLFILITGTLFLLSTYKHCELDMNTYLQYKYIKNHQPILYLLLAVIITLVLIIIYNLLNKLTKEKGNIIAKTVIKISLIIESILCSIWIIFNDTIPHSDQRVLFEEARKIVGFSSEAFNHEYVIAFKFQKFVILLLSLFEKLFGDSQMPFRWFNVIGALLLVLGLSLLINIGTNDDAATALISIVSLFFYPITIYTCYLYGTLWAVTCEVLAFYGIVAFTNTCHSPSNVCNKKCIKYGFLSVLFISLGIQMHLSALIGMVAGIVYLIININIKNIKNNLILITCIISFYLFSSYIINVTYDTITGCPQGDAIPISAKIYMGTTSAETQPWGPGSQDGSYEEVYILNDRDASKTNEYLLPILKDVAVDYLTGRRNPSFFLKKIEYQWLDPSIDAHRIILLNNQANGEPANSEAFVNFYYSSFRTLAFRLITVFMIVLYGLSLISGLYCLLKLRNIDFHFLVQIFVIGGFVFQVFAESASRYVVSYYILLLIEAIYGIIVICKFMNIRNKK